jgi:hypothetical protein
MHAGAKVAPAAGDHEVAVEFDFDENRLPATRRAVRWMLGLLAVAGAIDGLGPLAAQAGLDGRTTSEVVTTAVALTLPWLVAAALLPSRPRLATGMAIGMSVVVVPRQLWQMWLLGNDLVADGDPLFPDLTPRVVLTGTVLLTLWMAYLARPRGHWSGQVSPLTRRALVPAVMALLWTIGPIADPAPSTGAEHGTLLPLYLGNPLTDIEPWIFTIVHALPVLVAAVIAVGRQRRVAGAGMTIYGATVFLLVLAEFFRGRSLHGSSLLPLGGVTFLGLVSLIVIGHQWSTEGARFVDPGRLESEPGRPAE